MNGRPDAASPRHTSMITPSPPLSATAESLPARGSRSQPQASTSYITDLYDKACRVPSDISAHLPALKRLVVETNAQHVIELGVRSGNSTVAFLAGLDETGGRLTSVDIDEAPNLPQHARWRFIRGDDCSPGVFTQLEPADIVFIDTSHLYQHTVVELNLYRHLARRFIVCHDTELETPIGAPLRPKFPVRTAIEEFCDEHGYRWVNHPGSWGLGVITIAEEP